MKEARSFIATYPAGCYDIVARELKKFSVNELKIISHDESSVMFDSTLTLERLIELRFFTNIFMILKDGKLLSYKPYLKGSSFRLIALVNGKPTSIADSERNVLSGSITKELHLKANAARYSNDFVLVKRDNNSELLTLRLPRAKHKREKLPQGALRPELAHILLLVSGIKAKDTLLDPFAGYGSILYEASRGFGLKHTIAIEKDAELVKQLEGKGFEVRQGDAASIKDVASGSVDKIVTDPPWGIYGDTKSQELRGIYAQALNEIKRVLKQKGIAVFLSGSRILDETILSSPDFELLKSYPVLVSGKKATIYKLQKT